MPMPTTPFLILAFAIIQPVKSNCESYQKSTGGKNACDNPTHSVNACGATFDPTGWTSKMIEVTSDCALAASYYASELSDKNIGTAAGVNWQALQYGCSIHTDNNLYVNTKPDSKIKADSYGSRCSATTPCFCFIGKPCENTLAKIENTGACLCGVSACSSGTGLYCHLEASKCNPVPICTIIDGSDVDNIGWIFAHGVGTRVRGYSDFSGIVDYFVDWNQWIVLCVRDARHWVRCMPGQVDRRSVEEDKKE